VAFVSKQAITEDKANVFADTGWFQLNATSLPSADDLAALQKNVGDAGALAPPAHWDPIVDPSVVQRRDLKKGDPEYDAVVNAFLSTLKNRTIKNVKVERVQNLAMWQSYVVKRQTICYRETGHSNTSADASVQQRKALERFEKSWLWHGTNPDVMEKILQQGFNRSFCGKNATMYGKGVYFARDAAYSSHKMYAVPDRNGYQYVMVCRVVVGEFCPGKMDAVSPEIRDVKSHSLYDTTVGLLSGDTLSNPSIYVTYHDAQAYPEVSHVRQPVSIAHISGSLYLPCLDFSI
jgi:poly [ADP-ribose] polymerase 10/14/15